MQKINYHLNDHQEFISQTYGIFLYKCNIIIICIILVHELQQKFLLYSKHEPKFLMYDFSFYYDPILQILRQEASSQLDEAKNKLVKLNNYQLGQIEEKFKENHSLSTVLTQYGFNHTFSQFELHNMLNKINPHHEPTEEVTFRIFNMIIAWIIQTEMQKSVEFINLILDAFLYIIPSNSKNISFKLFSTTIFSLCGQDYVIECEKFVEKIVAIIILSQDLPYIISNSFQKWIKRETEMNDSITQLMKNFLKCLAQLYDSHNFLFTNEMDMIILDLNKYFTVANIDTIEFFSQIAKKLPDTLFIATSSTILTSFLEHTNKREVEYTVPDFDSLPEPYVITDLKIIDIYPTSTTFQDDIKFETDKPIFYPLPSLNEQDCLVLKLLSKAFSQRKVDPLFIVNVLESFLKGKLENEHACDLLCVSLNILSSYISDVDPFQLFEILMNSFIFSPKISYFNQDKYEQIVSLRTFFFSNCAIHSTKCIQLFFDKFMKIPSMMREFFAFSNQIESSTIVSKVFMTNLAQVMELYQSDHFKNPDNEVILRTRLSIVKFFNVIVEKSSVALHFFQSKTFSAIFFSMLYEDKLRQYLLRLIISIMHSGDQELNKNIKTHFVQFFTQSSEQLGIEYNQMYSNILSTLNTAFENDIELIKDYVTDFPPKVIQVMLQCVKSQEMLHQTLRLFILLPENRIVKSNEIAAIEKVITELDGEEPCEQTFNDLIRLISICHDAELNHNTIIKRPKLLTFVVKIFKKSIKLIDLLNYFNRLCVYSVVNCRACHTGKLDLLLLDFIRETATIENVGYLDPIFSLLARIASISSSILTVHHLISLMCPVEKKFLPFYIIDLIKTLTNIMLSRHDLPVAYLPIGLDSPVIEISPFSSFIINKGFTISMLLFLDPCSIKYNASIFFLQDRGQYYSLLIKIINNQLNVISVINNEKNWCIIPIDIPTNQWKQISITFRKTGEIEVTIDKVGHAITQFEVLDFRGIVSCIIGSNDQTEGNPALIGHFSFSSSDSISIDLNMEITNSLLSVSHITTSPVMINLIGPDVVQTLSLPDVLISYFRVESLLPLIAQIDLLYPNDTHPNSFAVTIIHLLSSAITLNENSEETFGQYDLISFLLYSNDPKNLTFNLYIHFVTLYSLLKFPKSKRELMDNILMNTDLWSRSSEEDQVQITYHWLHNLFPTYKQEVNEVRPFAKLIKDITSFYWKPNATSLKFKIRSNLLQLLDSISKVQFNQDDLEALFGATLSSVNMEYTNDLLGLISLISMVSFSPLVRVQNRAKKSPKDENEDISVFASLSTLFTSGDESIIASVIKTYIALYDGKVMIKFPLHHVIDILMYEIPPKAYTKRLILPLLEYSTAHPSLLQIVCYIVSQTGSDNLKCFLSTIHPNPVYCYMKEWVCMIWPLVVALKFQEESLAIIMDFIVKSGMKDILAVFSLIDVVGYALDVDCMNAKRTFLKIVGIYILDNLDCIKEDKAQAYLNICEFFIFTKPISSIANDALLNEFENSPFNETQLSLNDSMYSSDFLSLTNSSSIPTFASSEFYFTPSLPSEDSKLIPDNDLKPSTFNIQAEEEDEENFMISDMFYLKIKELSQKKRKFKFGINIYNDKEYAEKNLIEICNIVIDKLELEKKGRYNIFKHFLEINHDNAMYDEIVPIIEERIKKISIQPSRLAINISQYQVGICRSRKYFNNHKQEEIFTKANLDINNDQFTSIRIEQSKKWSRLWNQLTFDERAPWQNALPSVEQHWKRDSHLYLDLCPRLMKRNQNYVDHKDASINRDIGSLKKAESLFQEHLEQLAKQKLENAPPKLLEVPIEIETKNTEIIETDKEIIEFPGNYITIKAVKNITFKLFRDRMVLIFNKEENDSEAKEGKTKIIKAFDTRYIFMRSYLHHPKGFEVITQYGDSHFIEIEQPGLTNLRFLQFIKELEDWKSVFIQTLPYKEFFQQSGLTEMWLNGELSNFQYIMRLNMFSSRTFNNTSLYPVFPWIIKDYDSNSIDFNDPSIYRDLSQPIGTFNEKRLEELLSHMTDYEQFHLEAFLYNVCYVSPLCVYLWLMRMEPFTTLHIQLQSGKFDHAARIFSSVPNAFKMATSHMNDYRELIPEFFYSNVFLENRNHFDLGSVGDKVVNDATLPPWSKNALDFIYLHRKALESEYVSKNINNWIDLIWGYKQTGVDAKEANNTFDPHLYETVWDNEENYQNPDQRIMIEAMLEHCGHIPVKLFNEPHPIRNNKTPEPITDIHLVLQSDAQNCIFSSIWLLQEKQFLFVSILQTGEIIRTIVNFDEMLQVTNTTFKISIDLSLTSKEKSHCFAFSLKMVRMVAVTDVGALKIIDFKQQKSEMIYNHIGRINCVAIDSQFIVSGGSDTTISIYKNVTVPTHHRTISSYREEITCVDVCSDFGLVAGGTRDGSILLISVVTGTTIYVIDMGSAIPLHLRITRAWGFVVVHSTDIIDGNMVHAINVYSIDGDLVRSQQVPFTVTYFTTWASADGFDYLIISDSEGNCYVCEAYYLNISEPFGKCQSKIVSMEFSEKYQVLSAITKDGHIYFFTPNEMHLERLKNHE